MTGFVLTDGSHLLLTSTLKVCNVVDSIRACLKRVIVSIQHARARGARRGRFNTSVLEACEVMDSIRPCSKCVAWSIQYASTRSKRRG